MIVGGSTTEENSTEEKENENEFTSEDSKSSKFGVTRRNSPDKTKRSTAYNSAPSSIPESPTSNK